MGVFNINQHNSDKERIKVKTMTRYEEMKQEEIKNALEEQGECETRIEVVLKDADFDEASGVFRRLGVFSENYNEKTIETFINAAKESISKTTEKYWGEPATCGYNVYISINKGKKYINFSA